MADGNITGAIEGITTTASLSALDSLPQIMGDPEMNGLNLSELQDLALWATGFSIVGIIPAALLILMLLVFIVFVYFTEKGEVMAYNEHGNLVPVEAPEMVWTVTRNKPVAICIFTIYGLMCMSFIAINTANPAYSQTVSSETGMLSIIEVDVFDTLIEFGKEFKAEINSVREYVVDGLDPADESSIPSKYTNYTIQVETLNIGTDRFARNGQNIGLKTKHFEILPFIKDYCETNKESRIASSSETTHKVAELDFAVVEYKYSICPEWWLEVDNCIRWDDEATYCRTLDENNPTVAQPYWQKMQDTQFVLVEHLKHSQSVIKNETDRVMASKAWSIMGDLEDYREDLVPLFKQMKTVDKSTIIAFRVIFGVPILLFPIIMIPKIWVFQFTYVCTWCCSGLMFFLLGLYLFIAAMTKGFCLYLDEVQLVGFEMSWKNTTAQEIGLILDTALRQEGFLKAIDADNVFQIELPLTINESSFDHNAAFVFPKWDEHTATMDAADYGSLFTPPLECSDGGDPEQDCTKAEEKINEIYSSRQEVTRKIKEVETHGREVASTLLEVNDLMEYFEGVEERVSNLKRFTELSDAYWNLKKVACNELLDASADLLWHMFAEAIASIVMAFALILFTRQWKILIGEPLPEKCDEVDDVEQQKSRKSQHKRQSMRKSMRKEGEKKQGKRKPSSKVGDMQKLETTGKSNKRKSVRKEGETGMKKQKSKGRRKSRAGKSGKNKKDKLYE